MLGTEKHDKYLKRIGDFEEVGCFALTEMGHGSNVQQLETTATLDLASDTFVINSPAESAMKFWIGGAAKTATIAILWAQLIIEGKNYGVQAFVVRLRDSETHEICKDLTIGDCGPKIGVHGIDNGFIVFHEYRVPKEAMLDRLARVTSSGQFISDYKA